MRHVVAVALAAGCGGPSDSGLSTDEAVDLVAAAIEGYEAWGQHEDFAGIVPSEGTPHTSPYVQVWFEAGMLEALNAEAEAFPTGSIAVKRAYEDAEGSQPGRTWAYAKLEDWTQSPWFWVAWNADGSLLVAGNPGPCTGCHSGGIDGADLAVSY